MFDRIVSSIGAFSYKHRKIIALCALVLFVTVFIMQSFLVIEYSYADENLVTDIFPQDDTVVIVYENRDENKIQDIINYLEQDEHVTSIQAYANTLGMPMSTNDMSSMMGIPVSFVNTLFYMYENDGSCSMTLVEFVNFLSSDEFLNNELFASMIDDETKGQIGQMGDLVNAMASDEKYSVEDISSMLGIDDTLVRSVFYIAQLKQLNLFNITPMFWAKVAEAFGMEASTIERLFGVTPVSSLRFSEFVDIVSEVAGYASGIMDAEQTAQLGMLKTMSDIVKSGTEVSPKELEDLFAVAANNDMFNENTVSLLFMMAKANTSDMSNVKIPLYNFFMFLSENVLNNEAFSSFFDESVASQFEEAKTTMQDGLVQLVGPNHSRMIITLDYALESEGIYTFYENFDNKLDTAFEGEYQIVGSTAMSYEVSQTFDREFLIISVVTAIVVFLVVLLTFRKFILSLLLIGVIECAVFSMMSVMVLIDFPMYFIPLILVQCILMGSMIDYGILFTTYYTEVRRDHSIEDTLPEVMRRSTHSILTSSLLIVAVTLICGRFMTGAVASILTTLGIGSLCAILLVLFVLPSLLVIFDRYVVPTERNEVEIDEFD